MSPPGVDGASEAEPHPVMIFWPSFKQMAEGAGARRMKDHEEEEVEHDTCSSTSCCSASDYDEDDFEFAPVSGDPDGVFTPADVLHFPVFDLSSLLSQEESQLGMDVGMPSPALGTELPETPEDGSVGGPGYCLWRPKPRSEPDPEPPVLETAGKCRSTGGVPARSCPSSPREELAATARSASDGAGRFRFLASPSRAAAAVPAPKAAGGGRPRKEKKKPTETDLASVHRLFYAKHQDGAAAGGGHAARRSYLPYRKDLVGFFAGGTRFLPF